jgi:hypothetical protein
MGGNGNGNDDITAEPSPNQPDPQTDVEPLGPNPESNGHG